MRQRQGCRLHRLCPRLVKKEIVYLVLAGWAWGKGPVRSGEFSSPVGLLEDYGLRTWCDCSD